MVIVVTKMYMKYKYYYYYYNAIEMHSILIFSIIIFMAARIQNMNLYEYINAKRKKSNKMYK